MYKENINFSLSYLFLPDICLLTGSYKKILIRGLYGYRGTVPEIFLTQPDFLVYNNYNMNPISQIKLEREDKMIKLTFPYNPIHIEKSRLSLAIVGTLIKNIEVFPTEKAF